MSEPLARRKSRLRRTVLVVLACYWLAAFAATHVPVPQTELLPQHSDKAAHVLMYAGLAFLLGVSLRFTRPLGFRTYAIILAIVAAYAVVDELLQIPVNRSADFGDGAADAAGALIGLTILHFSRPILARVVTRGPSPRVD